MADPRRFLMITGAWPPVGRVGARRPLRLARRLPALGWDPVVITPDPDSQPFFRPPALDHSLKAPPVEVLRVPAFYPGLRLRRAMMSATDALGPLAGPGRRLQGFIDGWLYPDHFVEWIPAAVKAAREAVRTGGPVEVVWVTGGPWGMFPAAAAVARALNRPLVLDYRDPWTVAPPVKGAWRRMPLPMRALMEKAIVHQAAGISYVYRDTLERNEAAFGRPAGADWQVIPNGFDRADLPDTPPIQHERPVLLYTGACYESRSMKPVLEALHAGFGPGEAGLMLRVFGELDPPAAAFLQKHPMPGRVEINGRVPAAELAGLMRGADGLLVIIGEDHQRAIAAKIFDYLMADRPMLGLGPAGSDAAGAIEQCGAGLWVDSGDRDRLIAALKQVEARDLPWNPQPEAIEKHSADATAEAIAGLLTRVADSGG